MPGRKIPLITNQIYHVYNRGINRQPTFTNTREYKRAVESLQFYQTSSPPIKLSRYLQLEEKRGNEIIEIMTKMNKTIKMLSYCLMPNHFHFLIKQELENGIAKFLSNFQNSYTRYFNVKHNRDGPLFLDQFKAVRMETEEQLVHLSRYIHLNPHTGFIIKSPTDLKHYHWSSFPDYLKLGSNSVNTEIILSMFKNTYDYEQFVYDQADYQRDLKMIEHLVIEHP
ncbi:transposase [Patescibacteria group bacterium]|nr:transposase [Patescibacteria group bacterium]MBU4017098.1 transposase [Patescibacteria group bacterium]MBU4099521.1 transposase [Patescibacteria group bacterium]